MEGDDIELTIREGVKEALATLKRVASMTDSRHSRDAVMAAKELLVAGQVGGHGKNGGVGNTLNLVMTPEQMTGLMGTMQSVAGSLSDSSGTITTKVEDVSDEAGPPPKRKRKRRSDAGKPRAKKEPAAEPAEAATLDLLAKGGSAGLSDASVAEGGGAGDEARVDSA